MANRKVVYLIIFFLVILALIPTGIIRSSQSQGIKVVFFDVGQGDAILIQQGNKQVLIDGGPDGKKMMEKLGEYVPFWDREIEMIIVTHPDQDHIGGLVDVMKNYKVDEVLDDGVIADSQIYKKYEELINQKNISYLEAKAGMDIEIGNGAKLEILSPGGNQEKNPPAGEAGNPKDTNISSVVSRLDYDGHSFLFTGDLPIEGEKNFPYIKSDILKIAHHGSKSATSEEFLKKIKPTEAVISVGKNNRYGHPSEDVIDRLLAHEIVIKRTDEVGDIEYSF